ncbi:FAD-dependent monooxygenase [Amycolatopsis sp. K13G38]|uniref:FAD-dependent monooxygenase n=1 Tax=Amycolatopsis acididurans TaxID=2724524 RepID=A0ABX1J3C2_9PSEU|nr:FAD-dependent monooxygenase [Amycolatopsis acididurans]NKQ54253.1 FAD-dependent monooxygenase [Amycolatopsis acididurans]
MSFGRAVVIGGSISGLLSAAALSETFDAVTIVERDELPHGPEHRRGVPQGLQVHALLAVGQEAMEDLLRGLGEDFQAAGGVVVDSPADLAVYTAQGWSGRVESEARVVCMRRPALEWVIRRRVAELPNVEIVKATAAGLIGTDDAGRVTGVTLRGSAAASISADLVVDASGRSSRAGAWLENLGYDKPREVELRSFIGYATVPVRLPEDALPEGVKGVLAHPHPGNPQGAAVVPCDNGLYLVAGLGMVHADPPSDREEFLAHLDKAPSPLVGEIARKAEFLAPVETYRMPGSRRRLWEELERMPEGFVLVGDAVMSFNPLYGQGMSVAAVEARLMRDVVRDSAGERTGLASRIQRSFKDTIDTVFGMVVNIDGLYDDAELLGVDRPSAEAVTAGRYLSQLATEDVETCLAQKYAAHYFSADKVRSQSIQDKLREWIASGREVTHTDPRCIPEIMRR